MLSDYGKRINSLSGVRSIMSDIEQTLSSFKSTNFINLSAGNPNIIPCVVELWKRHLNQILSSSEFEQVVCRYGPTRGYNKFIETIVSMMNSKYNFRITNKNVLVTPGSQQFYFYAINAFTGYGENGGKKVLFPLSPEYTGYSNMGIESKYLISQKPNIQVIGDHLFKYKINFNSLDLRDIGLVILSRPCNPSGNVVTDDEVGKLVGICKQKNIPVIIDSAYAPPVPNLAFTNMNLYYDENVIHVMSFSKAGLPGMRVGVAIGNEKLIQPLLSFQSNVCLKASVLGQALAARAIESGELVEICENVIKKYYEDKFKIIDKCINNYFNYNIPYYIHKSEGTFFRWLWFKDLPITDWELYQMLKEEGVIIVPGSTFFPGLRDSNWKHQKECIRISLTATDDEIIQGIKKLSKVINNIYR